MGGTTCPRAGRDPSTPRSWAGPQRGRDWAALTSLQDSLVARSVGELARAGSPHTRLPLNGWCQRPACLRGAEKQTSWTSTPLSGSQGLSRVKALLPGPASLPQVSTLLPDAAWVDLHQTANGLATAYRCTHWPGESGRPSSYVSGTVLEPSNHPPAMSNHAEAIIEPAPSGQLVSRAEDSDEIPRP
ncbi:hypothetical protein BU16DRAFT_558665 [Lophium mytilinum]|uniref:Uncharacterized protein n=1 Tax=Lophium mytilinum TaxID=390894 RepID=A0A6A6R3W4_9PEZI|nr:hypothetical protein BU16DRAFT_558665 [Lophium mytilinum]